MFNEKLFKAQMVLQGLNVTELAGKMGINASTLYRKIKADGDFSRSEINQMIDILHIENPQEIFFAQELA